MFKLSKWPFDQGEIVQLFWVESPFKNNDNEWILPLLFKAKSKAIVCIETTWSNIPLLRFGNYYVDGTLLDFYQEGSIFNIEFEDASQGQVFDASFLPSDLVNGVGLEKVWMFESKGCKYVVPCIELVRSFFACNSTLAKAVIEPNELDFICTPLIDENLNLLKLYFNTSVPKKILNSNFIQHLAWIYANNYVKSVWNSVSKNVAPRGNIEKSHDLIFEELESKKITSISPIKGKSKWQVRGTNLGAWTFIYEIVSVEGISLPFQNIVYHHNLFTSKKPSEGLGALVRSSSPSKRRTKINEKLIINDNPGKASRFVIKNLTPILLGFNSEPKISKESKEVKVPSRRPQKERQRPISKRERREAEIRAHQEKLRLEMMGCEAANQELVSSTEVLFTGNPNVKSIEFSSVKTTSVSGEDGLESFCEMTKLFASLDSRIRVSDPKIMILPAGKSFAYKEDGTHRKVGIVSIGIQDRVSYVLEVERKNYLATLIIQSKTGTAFEEHVLATILNELLTSLVNRYGTWNKKLLENHSMARINKVKHLEEWTTLDWAKILFDRLNLSIYSN